MFHTSSLWNNDAAVSLDSYWIASGPSIRCTLAQMQRQNTLQVVKLMIPIQTQVILCFLNLAFVLTEANGLCVVCHLATKGGKLQVC